MTKITERDRLIAKIDTLWSLWIRLRDRRRYGPMCRLCGLKPIQQANHWITRTKYATRWDERNGVAVCSGCNCKYEHDQVFIERALWNFKNWYGQKAWDDLAVDSHRIRKFSNEDLRVIRRRLETNLAALSSEVLFGRKA